MERNAEGVCFLRGCDVAVASIFFLYTLVAAAFRSLRPPRNFFAVVRPVAWAGRRGADACLNSVDDGRISFKT